MFSRRNCGRHYDIGLPHIFKDHRFQNDGHQRFVFGNQMRGPVIAFTRNFSPQRLWTTSNGIVLAHIAMPYIVLIVCIEQFHIPLISRGHDALQQLGTATQKRR